MRLKTYSYLVEGCPLSEGFDLELKLACIWMSHLSPLMILISFSFISAPFRPRECTGSEFSSVTISTRATVFLVSSSMMREKNLLEAGGRPMRRLLSVI
jgi:hypothetical protein